MDTGAAYELLTRIGRLLQAEERTAGPGLQPVQLHALHYLGRSNRYSDRPSAVAEYLGVSKGTASQTLNVLEEAGLVAKRRDTEDKRVTHLVLTAKGRRLVTRIGAQGMLGEALGQLSEKEADRLEVSLRRLLSEIQRANGRRTFGVCGTCRHLEPVSERAYRCGLTREPLAVRETELICREHEPQPA